MHFNEYAFKYEYEERRKQMKRYNYEGNLKKKFIKKTAGKRLRFNPFFRKRQV